MPEWNLLGFWCNIKGSNGYENMRSYGGGEAAYIDVFKCLYINLSIQCSNFKGYMLDHMPHKYAYT